MSETFDLAGTLANYDLNESTLRRYLAERMARLAEDRKKGITQTQTNSVNRGLLHSSVALNDVADTNLGFDRNVGEVNDSFNSDLMKIAQGRVDAQNQYQLYLQNQAKATAAAKPTFDPTDPYNWKGIAAEQAANGTAPASAPVDPADPFNWKGIAAEQAAQQRASANGGTLKPGSPVTAKTTPMVMPVVNSTVRPGSPAKPKSTPVVAPPRPTAPSKGTVTKPKQGYY
jgi:hypothetical protein